MLECRIPLSPTPAFINRARLIAAAIRQQFPITTVRVSCYPTTMPSSLTPGGNDQWNFVGHHEAIRWKGTRSPFLATMMDRYKAPFRGDFILMLDADVIPVGDFSELLGFDGLQGVQAHHSPYGVAGWQRLFTDFLQRQPLLAHEYSAYGIMEQRPEERFGPFYPNSGMVFGPREHFEALAQPFDEAIDFLRGMVGDTYWFDQVGFALGVAMANIPCRSLPLRWNFPNRPFFDVAKPEELADVRFLHAMQTDIVDRDRDFQDVAAMQALALRRDLTGSNEALRSAVARLLPLAFPWVPVSTAEDAPWA